MAAKKKSSKGTRASTKSPAVEAALVKELERLVRPLNLDVLGHVRGSALCCRNGTVALVKIDTVSNPPPKVKTKRPR